jgi:hypothetical protein
MLFHRNETTEQTRNRNLMTVDVIAIATSTITGILASTYIIQQANVQNQTRSLLLLLLTNFKEESFTYC